MFIYIFYQILKFSVVCISHPQNINIQRKLKLRISVPMRVKFFFTFTSKPAKQTGQQLQWNSSSEWTRVARSRKQNGSNIDEGRFSMSLSPGTLTLQWSNHEKLRRTVNTKALTNCGQNTIAVGWDFWEYICEEYLCILIATFYSAGIYHILTWTLQFLDFQLIS